MATADGREGSHEAPNNLDDLFDYDVGIEDIMNNDVSAQANNASSSNNQNRPAASKDSGAGLGLDKEVTVTKKRKPTVKFNESRLLSQAGIPKLRKTAKTKLKFKGKGHEFSDAARLLNFYQLWLDDLFPRAKFADGLSMVEKLGHSKRIQVMRREWIDEGKPKLYSENENDETNPTDTNPPEATSNTASGEQGASTRTSEPEQASPLGDNTATPQPENAVPSIFGGGGNTALDGPSAPNHINDDDDNLFCTDEEDNNDNNTSAPKNNDAIPDEDDLDALLAEQEAMEAEASVNASKSNNASGGTGTGAQRPPDDDEFADEMEAMAGMDHPW